MSHQQRRRWALAAYDRIIQLRWPILLAVLCTTAWASWQTLTLPFDMSFRPLFADDPVTLAKTTEFEAVFGQASGDFIGAILSDDDILSPDSLATIRILSSEVAKLEHVTEIISPTRTLYPAWLTEGNPILRLAESSNPELRQKAITDPYLAGKVISKNGQHSLILARLDLPMANLQARTPVIEAFQKLIEAQKKPSMKAHFVGVSVVEAGYAKLVRRGIYESTGLIALLLIVVAYIIFGHALSVAIVLSGVSFATPLSLGIMNALGQKMTLMNSMVPTIIMVIGVADAIHLLSAFQAARRRGMSDGHACKEMFAEMAMPCFMTALTTGLGFVSLCTTQVQAIRDFGFSVTVAVAIMYVLNSLLVPTFISWFPPPLREQDGRINRGIDRAIAYVAFWVTEKPRLAVAGVSLIALFSIALLPKLEISQQFNNELPVEHPIRAGQMLLEKEFSGFLGPEISLKRVDQQSLLTPEDIAHMRAFVADLHANPDIAAVNSYLDLAPPNVPSAALPVLVDMARLNPESTVHVNELLNRQANWTSIGVRVPDIGTVRARLLVDDIKQKLQKHFGAAYQADVVGQWWMAQEGMMSLLDNMLRSFITACFTILPIMAFMLRSPRLIAVSIPPNILPNICALAFMVISGITLRISTAMMMAIALGIAVDDTVHFMSRLRDELEDGYLPKEATRRALSATGRPIAYTSIILIFGFLSLRTSEILAIQDMGTVGAACMAVGLLGDVILAPAMFLLLSARKKMPTPESSAELLLENTSGAP